MTRVAAPHGLPRLYVEAQLAQNAEITASDAQAHYLLHVMRCSAGHEVILFNGHDGEWTAHLELQRKRHVTFVMGWQRRPQESEPDVWLLFAPLKPARVEMLVEKATELGVGTLVPVVTHRTNLAQPNLRRLAATAIEAAEQCERLTVPIFQPVSPLPDVVAAWTTTSGSRTLFFLDEGGVRGGNVAPIAQALASGAPAPAFLVGPEGGFDDEERLWLRGLPFVRSVSLGPRILRAETAALAALACWQAFGAASTKSAR